MLLWLTRNACLPDAAQLLQDQLAGAKMEFGVALAPSCGSLSREPGRATVFWPRTGLATLFGQHATSRSGNMFNEEQRSRWRAFDSTRQDRGVQRILQEDERLNAHGAF